MKKSILMTMSALMLTVLLSINSVNAQDKKPNWPGVTIKVLTENDKVNISEVTFEPGAVADWHEHPQHTVYALTDVKMLIEEKGKENVNAEIKAGQAIWSPAISHRTSNVGKTAFKVIVTEIK
jgi:quercetin dioxygenase-like cupin family protein